MFKLGQKYSINEKVLEQIGYKYTTLRFLKDKIHNFKPKNPSDINSLNNEAIEHFNPPL